MTYPSRLTLLVSAAALAALTACSSTAAPATPGTPAGDTFGRTEGASEVKEAPLRLVGLADDGALTALDPATGESSTLATLDATGLSTDGRYVFASTEGALTIVDGGAWTVPHGDHSHYYVAEPRVVGELDGGGGEARVASSASLTALYFPGSGTGVVLDAEALSRGEISELGRFEGTPHDGALLPLGDQVVGSIDGATLTASSGEGEDEGEPSGPTAPCMGLHGSALTRVGAVFGCSDGAVLATESGEGIAFERIAYPEGTPAADIATAFSGRPGRPEVAAVAGERGAWLLDTRERSWALLPSPEPLLAASAVSDADGTVVGVDRSGRVVVLGPDGVAATEPLLAADLVDGRLPDGVTIEIDAARASVNSPSTGLVHEIDYGDSARVARSLELGARHLVETGR
ncbi:hypothetical protein EV639_1084 [Rathayibacter tanaceti]|uniref:Uncharacterized protein n=2 Tax=Rathayibacter tanaceti TaxID=1671680 RepID=A0ACD2XHY2_9MICO|nr:ABC transporter [Rathayibacter tanaceti]QHC56703.1 ABC transporter [Rathayibacter tanaceti]TCO36140.1 hypothetical protein EV639_1084 [Rathayibacter tanaceti]